MGGLRYEDVLVVINIINLSLTIWHPWNLLWAILLVGHQHFYTIHLKQNINYETLRITLRPVEVDEV